jgi:hypothetical protein
VKKSARNPTPIEPIIEDDIEEEDETERNLLDEEVEEDEESEDVE